ncbi:hypothetical protein N0V90_011654 [Kalmusia sp. IMI 367209]|nr:hypothetical protein N0V90_011654 [Kalmusia sp. IMI 367209]
MADLAVGLVSLALQVSQGLAKYVQGVRDRKDTISHFVSEAERLADILERLDSVVKRAEQSPCQEAVTTGIIECAKALDLIKARLGIRDASRTGFRDQMRVLGEKLAFPFKQEKLAFLKDVLRDMERHLHTALHAFNLARQEETHRQLTSLMRLGVANYQGLTDQLTSQSSSISPFIKCDYVVPKNSPAFRLLANFESRLEPDLGPDAWEKPANELLRLFQMRKASPHDRLPNGMTLLHYYCYKMNNFIMDDAEKLAPNYHAMAGRLLQYLPTQATDHDDNDISSGPGNMRCSEQMKCVLLRDEQALVSLIKRGRTISDHKEHHTSIYSMATRLGWRRGCEILLENRVPIATNDRSSTLLRDARVAKQLEMAIFWLDARGDLDESALKHIGDIQQELLIFSGDRHEWREIFISTLVRQRQELHQLALEHRIPTKTDRLLDAQMGSVIKRLERQGIQVKPSLKSNWQTVYHVPSNSWDFKIVEALYAAGFHDINAHDTMNDIVPSVSPLLFYLTNSGARISLMHLADLSSCYILHGADLTEQWPNSKSMTAHYLGYAMGKEVFSQWHARMPIENYREYFTLQCSDDCICACSTSGCLLITSFIKGLLTPSEVNSKLPQNEIERKWHSVRRSWRERLDIFVEILEKVGPYKKDRWLMTEAIRLVVFTELGMRHTCCDLARPMHDGDPDYTVAPTPRYDDEELRFIQEEDAYLRGMLEELVQKFDEEFDRWPNCIEPFLEFSMMPHMDEILNKLAADDREQFAQRRREMGVVMDEVDEDGDDDNDDDQMSIVEEDSDVEPFNDEELEE